ncbi:uncharacterized protein NECHADRAFT_98072 [Fusarium vanettenii 77-13-4]|uniref:Uncharacterized protein n=1 Tax=Fusarium vanettenii (strain ATCC MYA-4622 / CBS 123669 / FGSC 9596 / NRRL 45880 / 77-13-4) TaxID=660122 RepID=C7ZDK1_FUSV7|nr:uncharacterized protein NECHADRAFT_98072 [Fusarium vanettenii 77-13-4]EEU37840.1 hypothetical protein NECHADRAFT_98072 [Fusarium vanettenii 77-13-4]
MLRARMAESQIDDEYNDEPALVLEDTFRTENASSQDWERRNVIERTRGSIHTRVELLEVTHGTLDEYGDEATLMVFRFRFDPQKTSRRVLRARVNIEFMGKDGGNAPIVEAIAPEERWAVVPTTDSESTTRGAELYAASGVPFFEAGARAKHEKTISRDVSDATTVSGSINLGRGRNSGESTVAVWNLQENKRRETGVPDSVTTAVLLRRYDSEPFNARVELEADVDWVSGFARKFAGVPLDDPVLFNPMLGGSKPKRGRSYGAKDLGSVDLYKLCAVRFAVEAPFVVK